MCNISPIHQPEHVEDDDNEDDDQQGGQGHHDCYDWHVIRLVIICRQKERVSQHLMWVSSIVEMTAITKLFSYLYTQARGERCYMFHQLIKRGVGNNFCLIQQNFHNNSALLRFNKSENQLDCDASSRNGFKALKNLSCDGRNLVDHRALQGVASPCLSM